MLWVVRGARDCCWVHHDVWHCCLDQDNETLQRKCADPFDNSSTVIDWQNNKTQKITVVKDVHLSLFSLSSHLHLSSHVHLSLFIFVSLLTYLSLFISISTCSRFYLFLFSSYLLLHNSMFPFSSSWKCSLVQPALSLSLSVRKSDLPCKPKCTGLESFIGWRANYSHHVANICMGLLWCCCDCDGCCCCCLLFRVVICRCPSKRFMITPVVDPRSFWIFSPRWHSEHCAESNPTESIFVEKDSAAIKVGDV